MSNENGTSAVRLTVRGRVQGVWYRASAKRRAVHLGVTGWVRNSPDGTVEALACGDVEALEAFVAWCRQGPDFARVDDVTVVPTPAAEIPADFTVRR